MNKYPYDYVDDNKQYLGLELKGEPVAAQYIHAKNKKYAGNPFIEALPKPLSVNECSLYYSKSIHSYNGEAERSLPRMERVACVENLYNLRFPLPFTARLEIELYRALTDSYSKRYVVSAKNTDLSKYYPGTTPGSNAKLFGDDAEASGVGFGLIGFSGCGKSSALKSLLDKYPRVIKHATHIGSFTQVPYLVVNCTANSNFAALYAAIGASLDKTLGNLDCVYETLITKKHTLGEKANIVRQLIETFAIGIIIFDEIQLMNFRNTKENSYDSLLTLSNSTKVAIGAVGTEEAHNMMFPRYRTSRRIGAVIQADSYCEDQAFFDTMFKILQKYQWFDERIKFDDMFKNKLFERSGGIVENIIKIYANVQYEYLITGKKVSADTIDAVIKKYFNGTDRALKKAKRDVLNRKKLEATVDEIEEAERLQDKKAQEDVTELLISEELSKINSVMEILKQNVIADVLYRFPDLTDTYVENIFSSIYKRKEAHSLSEGDLTKMIIQVITNSLKENHENNSCNIVSKKPSTEFMKKCLENAY